jgi:hypothetical protein
VIEVDESTVYDAAAVPPKVTEPTPEKLTPVTVTLVPPVVGPLDGFTLVTEGDASVAVIVDVNGLF